ncbi:MAG: hypothetical protein DMD60_06015 [Gemmatimonadetes bacterium]|nr:MAG: hypothetical protein DMD60_06015 [Gemmatimonadota bacterium]
MDIFIDESGQFIPLGGAKSRAGATLALIVPSASRVALGRAFRTLKKQFGARGSEVKGASLSEQEAARVISLLQAYDVIVEAVVVDVGQHSPEEVAEFKTKQAERLIGNITRDHQPSLIQDLIAAQESMQALSNQLFLQVFCMWQLVPQLLETATMYYSQRRPAELGSFAWRVDAKDVSVTAMETLWTTLIGPLITAKTLTSPMGIIPGADYSYYERFDTVPADDSQLRAGHYYTDMKKVLRDNFKFASSDKDLGLQIADILASILTRALNGTLQKAGWQSLGSLFVRRDEQTLRLIALSKDASQQSREVTDRRWISVIQHIHSLARPMLTKHTMQLVRESGL